MSYGNKYVAQVKLLLQSLPFLCEQSMFALKGGTAINFFITDSPRLSVDIDLTYIHLTPRNEAIVQMHQKLTEYANWAIKKIPEVKLSKKMSPDNNYIVRLFLQQKRTLIKIEPSYVMRGVLFPISRKPISQKIAKEFGIDLDDVPVVDNADLYAGKICAALSRQHPRDLFDIKYLLENEGLSENIMNAFVVYLACDQRPIHELLSPNLKDISNSYNKEFSQMTAEPVSLDELYAARDSLIRGIKDKLTGNHKSFLISVKNVMPDYSLMPFSDLEKLPALIWKKKNIEKMDYTKRVEMLHKLEIALGM